MQNRNLSVTCLKTLRVKAVYAVIKQHAFSQKKAREIFGFCQTTMSKYIRDYKRYGENSFDYKKRGVKLGTGTLLTEEQEASLIQGILSHTPDQLGLDHTLWTSKVVNK